MADRFPNREAWMPPKPAPHEVFPVTTEGYVLEVKNALGRWERMSGYRTSLGEMKAYIESLWPEGMKGDEIRVVQIVTTQSLLANDAWMK